MALILLLLLDGWFPTKAFVEHRSKTMARQALPKLRQYCFGSFAKLDQAEESPISIAPRFRNSSLPGSSTISGCSALRSLIANASILPPADA